MVPASSFLGDLFLDLARAYLFVWVELRRQSVIIVQNGFILILDKV